MEKTLNDALKIIHAVRFQGDSTERLDLVAKMIIDGMEAENAFGGEFKDMLQQVLNHSNRPEMDDAQFRMFARENINYLLYGNKEVKKDE